MPGENVIGPAEFEVGGVLGSFGLPSITLWGLGEHYPRGSDSLECVIERCRLQLTMLMNLNRFVWS